MKLFITGDREFTGGMRWARGFHLLDGILNKHADMEVMLCDRPSSICELAEWWARNRKVTTHKATSDVIPKEATHALIFWDGQDPETKVLIELSRKRGLDVHVHEYMKPL